jgi:HK97 family phage major capsid protein
MSNSGIVVPNTIQQDVLLGVQGHYGILSAIDMRYTDDAGTMTFPFLISDLTLQKVTVGGTGSEGTAAWEGIQLSANDFMLPIIPVSETLLAGADVDVRAYLVQLFTELIGRGLSDRIINSGDDNKDIKAFLPQVKAAAAADTDAITFADIINLKSQVKAPYNQLDRASFVMASSTKDALTGLVDKNGRPIYIESMSAGVPDKLLGYPVVIDDAMPEVASKARVIAFGDFKAYKARVVKGVRVKTYDESKYSVQGCIGMQAFVAGDGRLVYKSGKVEPIAALEMA